MITPNWQLHTPIDALIFDCDGTLSRIEGIDELAKMNGVEEAVLALTAEAMGKTGMNPAVYKERLDLVRPDRKQVAQLGKEYFAHRTPDIETLIPIFQKLKKSIYIISAGLYPAVLDFGLALGLPAEHIFAVDIQFDTDNHYLNFDTTSPLVTREGKRTIVNQLKTHHSQMVYVGDGLNDYETHDLVRCFVGYGGAYYRENIANLCQFYIKTPSLSPLLPLTLTAQEIRNLNTEERILYDQGLEEIMKKQVIIRDS